MKYEFLEYHTDLPLDKNDIEEYLRVTNLEDDGLEDYIRIACAFLEGRIGYKIQKQQYKVVFDNYPSDVINLINLRYINSIEKIEIIDIDGNTTEFSGEQYIIDKYKNEIILKNGESIKIENDLAQRNGVIFYVWLGKDVIRDLEKRAILYSIEYHYSIRDEEVSNMFREVPKKLQKMENILKVERLL